MLFLVGYVAFIVGLGHLVGLSGGEDARIQVLDSLIVFLGVRVLAWVFLVSPSIDDHALSGPARAVAAAYPLLDLLLLGSLVRLVMQRRSWPVAHCLLAGWVATQLGVDLVYAVTTIGGTFEVEGPVTAALALSFVLLGAAVLHPSFGDAAGRPVDQRRIVGFRRLATVGGAALIAPSVLVVLGAQGRTDDVAMVALLSMVLLVLVLTRIGLLVVDAREHGRIQAELTHSVDEERRRAKENRDLVATLQERHALAQRLSRIQREISSRAPPPGRARRHHQRRQRAARR